MEKEDNLMFHPDPEVYQIKPQLQSADRFPDGIQEEMAVIDNSELLPPKVDGSLKSFRSQPLPKPLTPNTLILGPGNGSARFHVAGVAL